MNIIILLVFLGMLSPDLWDKNLPGTCKNTVKFTGKKTIEMIVKNWIQKGKK